MNDNLIIVPKKETNCVGSPRVASLRHVSRSHATCHARMPRGNLGCEWRPGATWHPIHTSNATWHARKPVFGKLRFLENAGFLTRGKPTHATWRTDTCHVAVLGVNDGHRPRGMRRFATRHASFCHVSRRFATRDAEEIAIYSLFWYGN